MWYMSKIMRKLTVLCIVAGNQLPPSGANRIAPPMQDLPQSRSCHLRRKPYCNPHSLLRCRRHTLCARAVEWMAPWLARCGMVCILAQHRLRRGLRFGLCCGIITPEARARQRSSANRIFFTATSPGAT